MDELWARSRTGSHAGRGFHYQDAVATELALRAWRGELAALRLIPEGLEDVSLDLPAHRLHLQAKSRRAHRGDFSDSELADGWRHLAERLAADPSAQVASAPRDGARHHRHAVTRAARTGIARPNRDRSSTVNRHRQ